MKVVNPSGPGKGKSRAVRSGVWFSNADGLIVACRSYYSLGYRDGSLSFRIVCNGRNA